MLLGPVELSKLRTTYGNILVKSCQVFTSYGNLVVFSFSCVLARPGKGPELKPTRTQSAYYAGLKSSSPC